MGSDNREHFSVVASGWGGRKSSVKDTKFTLLGNRDYTCRQVLQQLDAQGVGGEDDADFWPLGLGPGAT